MKKLIRKGVFETNSSSAHSVSIADDSKEFVLDTIYPDQDGTIELEGGQFGWEWFKHNDALTKANYVAATYGLTSALEEAIIEQTGADRVIYTGSDDYDKNWSYVDHDSYGVAPDSKESIRNFIFNKNSWLFGGNDNTEADPMFYNVPEYKEGREIKPLYEYILKIEGFNKETKFLSKPTEEQLTSAFNSLLDHSYISANGKFVDYSNSWTRDGRFEYSSWQKAPDLEQCIIYFTRDIWDLTNDEWEAGGKKEDREVIRKRISEDPTNFRAIKYHIDEI